MDWKNADRVEAIPPARKDETNESGALAALAAIRDNEERLRAVLETSVEGIITINREGTVLSINPAGEAIFGYEANELIGKNVHVLMPSPYHEEHDRYLESYHHTGKARIIGIGREVLGKRKNGSVFPMELSVSEVRLSRETIYAGFVRDISERRHLERGILEISEREKRRIGQDLHDDLGQQLTGIELMSRVLEKRLQDASPADSRHAAEIAKLVRDAIGHTRRLARGLTPATNLSGGLANALQNLARSTGMADELDCVFETRGDFSELDEDVATHLFRIAQEAVSNAVRHASASQIDIALVAGEKDIRLLVNDNGRGMANKGQGQEGLGLRLMQYRAGMIGGTLVIEQRPNGGTTIACTVKTSEERPTERKEISQ